MNPSIDPKAIEIINAVWATPYGVAAEFVFYIGVSLMIILLLTRHKMSLVHAVMVLVGAKKLPNKDKFFNLLAGTTMIGCFTLMVISMQVVLSAQQ